MIPTTQGRTGQIGRSVRPMLSESMTVSTYTRSERFDVKVWVPFHLPSHILTPQITVDLATDEAVRQLAEFHSRATR